MREYIDNYYGANCTSASLKLEIMESIWNALGSDIATKLKDSESPFDREKYYEVNRKLSDSLDKFIHILTVESTVDVVNFRPENKDRALHRMSHQIAEEIFKSDSIGIREFSSKFSPVITYRVEIPFLKLKPKTESR